MPRKSIIPSKNLADLLRDSLKPVKPRRPKAAPNLKAYQGKKSFQQTDIISTALCDDIIQYLGPSLEKYKGCTIIDFHPGASVWSSKLHDFLKPKRHLLIEPDGRYYDNFIKPLLNKPGSTYRHTSFSEHHPHSYFRAWNTIGDDRSLLDKRPSIRSDGLQERAIDPNVLVTGNLARRYGARSFSYNTKAGSLPYFLTRLVSTTLHNDAYHAPGLVRQLWWLPEEAKKAILPVRLVDKQSVAAGFDMAFSTSEVAGVTPYPLYGSTRNREMKFSRSSRLRALDNLNEVEVAERMAAGNMTIPKTRNVLRTDESTFQEETDYKSALSDIAGTVAELRKRISLYKARLEELLEWLPRMKHTREMPVDAPHELQYYIETMKYPQSRRAFDSWPGTVSHGASRLKLSVLTDMALRILNLEASYKEVESKSKNGPKLEKMRDAIITFDDDLHTLVSGTVLIAPLHITYFINEEIAANTVDSSFTLQKRSFEPLQAKIDEFWPNKELTLMDLTPRTASLSVPDLATQAEGARFCYTLLQHLYNSPRTPLPVALDKMAINAGKDLIPMVPAITDIRKGGRLNPMKMNARMLTHEMIVGLVKAFFEWPFRPQNWELELNTGSADFAASDSPDKADDAEEE